MEEKCDSDVARGDWHTKREPAVAVLTRSGKEVGPDEEEETSEDPSEGNKPTEDGELSGKEIFPDGPGRPTWRELILELVEKTPWQTKWRNQEKTKGRSSAASTEYK